MVHLKVPPLIQHPVLRVYTLIVIHCFCFFFARTSLGQENLVRAVLFEETELATGSTTGMCEDHQGFIWLGSEYGGLSRFDGRTLEHFTEDSHGLYSNSLTRIVATPDSMLILTYYNYVDQIYYTELFDPITHKVFAWSDYIQQDLPFDIKERLNIKEAGGILIFNQSNIWKYEHKKIRPVFKIEDDYNVATVYRTPQKALWVLAETRANKQKVLFYVDKNGKVLEKSLISHKTIVGGMGEGEELVLANSSNICRKVPFSPLEVKPFASSLSYNCLFYNDKLRQLGCIKKGDLRTIHLLNIEGQEIYEMPVEKQAINLDLDIYKSNGIYWNETNKLWFNTKKGLAQVYLIPNKFQRHLYIKGSSKRSPNPVRGIIKDLEGNLYINTYVTRIRKKEDSTFSLSSKHNVTSNGIFIDSSGLVWSATDQGYIYAYDPLADTVTIYKYNPNYKHKPTWNAHHWSVYQDRNRRIWTGHFRGLSYLDTTTGYLRLFEMDEALTSVFHFYENEQGIWILSSSGIYLIDYNYKIIQHYHKGGLGTEYLSHNVIAHLFEDKDQSFWLASKGGGLIHWNPKTGVQKRYNINLKGSDNIIYAVYPDDFGNLWCSSNYGIICFNKASKEMVFYTEDNGITNNEFNTISHYKDKDGTLYFGSLNGVTAFHPKDLIAEHTTAPLILSSVKKFNNISQKDSTITKEVLATKKISVLPSDREIKLRFALLDYDNPKRIEYAYQLAGLDKKWTSLERPEINLAGLPYGQYTLLIRAKGVGKKWKEAPLSIEITVLRPFYLSWWFLLLVVSCVVFVVTVIIKLRLRIAQEQQEELQKQVTIKTATIQEQTEALKSLDKMKTRFFVNISHELRTPLSLILGPLAHLVEKKKTDENPAELRQLELMERNGDRLLNLVEEILDLAKLDAQKIDLKEQSIQLKEFCRWIFSMFESKASLQKIDLKFDYQVEEDFYLRIDKNKTEKVLINLLGNALKFTPANGQVLFQIVATEDRIQFLVKNTGVGIGAEDLPFIFDRFYQSGNVEQGGTGVGLALSKEFAKLLQGDLYVNSVLEEGSTFTFVVPKVTGESTELMLFSAEEVAEMEEILLVPTIANIPSDLQVLIVEDNLDMQFFIQSLLKDSYQIRLTSDGQEAQKYLQTTDRLPDLIVSDIMMPIMDGVALLTWLKSEEKTSSIPVIMLTAKAAQENKLEALTIGVDDYLTKPFVPKELLARIRNLISQVQSRTEPIKQEETSDVPVIIDELREDDRIWIKEVEQLAKEMLENDDFNSPAFAKAMNLSLSSLQRRLKRITGLTITLYIRELRLQKARDLLERGVYGTIIETAYAAGFGSPYYFSKVYETHFGKKVSDYFKS